MRDVSETFFLVNENITLVLGDGLLVAYHESGSASVLDKISECELSS